MSRMARGGESPGAHRPPAGGPHAHDRDAERPSRRPSGGQRMSRFQRRDSQDPADPSAGARRAWRPGPVCGAPGTASWRSGAGSPSCSLAFAIGDAVGHQDPGQLGLRGRRVRPRRQDAPGRGAEARGRDGARPERQRDAPPTRRSGPRSPTPSAGSRPRPTSRPFESPYAPENRGNISSDGRSALLRFQIAGDDTEVQDRVGPALDEVAAVQAAHPGFTVGEFGDASAEKQIEEVVDRRLREGADHLAARSRC